VRKKGNQTWKVSASLVLAFGSIATKIVEPRTRNVVSLLKTLLPLAIGTLSVATPAFCQSAAATEPLSSAEIRHNLIGKLIDYSPPGSADAGMVEAFHEDGKWWGTYLSRGPINFSGRWNIEANQLCVVADRGSWAEKWHAGKYCRQVWENKRIGQLLLDHLTGHDGLQIVRVRELPR
jgi:hypothetical protein